MYISSMGLITSLDIQYNEESLILQSCQITVRSLPFSFPVSRMLVLDWATKTHGVPLMDYLSKSNELSESCLNPVSSVLSSI